MAYTWRLIARPFLALLAGGLVLVGFGCARPNSAPSLTVPAGDQDNRRLTAVEVGSTTRETPAACRSTARNFSDEGEGEDDSSGSSPETSARGQESAEALVSRLCKGCHGGTATGSGASDGSLFGRLRGRDRVIPSSIKFGGRDDLEIRTNDIIQEFENPGPHHSSIRNAAEVVQVFEALKEAKQRRFERKANKCI